LCPMENDIDTLRAVFRSEDDYHRAEQWWSRLWSGIPEATEWTSPWFNTCYVDGTPMLDANPIFSAKNERLGRGLRIIQERPENDPLRVLTWWKQDWDPDYDNWVVLTLIVVPSMEAIQAAKLVLCAWARGDDVDDGNLGESTRTPAG
jgi:hypothetical protein